MKTWQALLHTHYFSISSTTVSSIYLCTIFLYIVIFVPGLSYILNPLDAPIPSLPHTLNVDLPVPVCKVSTASKCIYILSSSYSEAQAQVCLACQYCLKGGQEEQISSCLPCGFLGFTRGGKMYWAELFQSFLPCFNMPKEMRTYPAKLKS